MVHKSAMFVVVAVLAGCTSSEPGENNPATLWLATNPGETQMLLVGEEPHPY